MEKSKLCASDYKFMDIVWENEPIKSGELVFICKERLGWKKSTTYTMLKKLSEKGYLKNENSIVTSVIEKKEVQMFESNYVVNTTFGGSLPSFIASFVSGKDLSKKEIEQIRSIIDNLEN